MDAMRRLHADQSLTVYDIYNRSIAAEFHLLLLCSISSFRWALTQYRRSLCSLEPTKEHDRIHAGRKVKIYGIMLWNITHSQLLEYHLELLEHSSPLTFPKYYCRDEYLRIVEQSVPCTAPGVDTSTVMADKSDSPSEDQENGVKSSLMNTASFLTATCHGKAVPIHSWLRLLVAHFIGASSLSEWARTHDEPVDSCVTLLRTAKPDSPGVMKCWKSVLNTPEVSSDPEADISLLISLLEDKKLSVALNGVVRQFREGDPHKEVTNVIFTGNWHCETVLSKSCRHYHVYVATEMRQLPG